ncbi:amidohydrolase family protein [Desertihabitans aurantiacus]|uniref:amidohydrolase family protein n=1 Tax=Desertihabitans aurantiacus TaxID=2282477 RepID=UPI00130043FF|nr:amidohydrolase family protein [Desertihabitans aurantiacus]
MSTVPAAEPVTDTHLHLWDVDRLDHPWLRGLPRLDRTHDVTEAAPAVPATRSIMMQADCRPDQALDEVAWVEEQTELGRGLGIDLVGMVAYAPLEDAGLARHLDALAERPLVVGIRRPLQGQPPSLLRSEELLGGLRLLGERGLAFDVCITADQLPAATELVRAAPGTTVVLDHLGKPPLRAPERVRQWLEDLRRLAELPQVVCKLSGLGAELDPGRPADEQVPWYLQQALELFGAERCLVGSDWPVSAAISWDRWLQLVGDALTGASPQERTAVLTGTAARVYRWER